MTPEKEQMVAVARLMESGMNSEFWKHVKAEVAQLVQMYDGILDSRDDILLARASEGRRVAKQIMNLPETIVHNAELILAEENE